jgi:cell wall-associated NlpC family hydrolase
MLKYGSRGEEVTILKQQLYDLGYLKTKPSHDRFLRDTENALKELQKDYGLEADGILGPKTRGVLDTLLAGDTQELKEKAAKMLDEIEKRVGDLYVWGGQGELATEEYIDKRAKARPIYVTKKRARRFKQYAEDHPIKENGEPLRCEDCSGLFWAAENRIGLLKANDSTARGLYKNYCRPIAKEELQPLDLVFSGTPISHMAIIGRGGKTYEAAGSEIGVVISDSVDNRILQSIYGEEYGCAPSYKKGKWTRFGRLKEFWGVDLRKV